MEENVYMKKLKIAVIGGGSISELHLKSYQRNPHVEIYAICDLNEERAKRMATEYGASRNYSNYQDALADSEIDAVSICTWTKSHAEISIAALDAGKHVLLEKPPAKTVEEVLLIQDAVKRSNKVLQIGFVRRYDANIQLLRTFADQGDFGEIYYAKASSIRRLGNPGGWFADKERAGGGPLIDIGVHSIDLCWYMMGKPKVKSVSGNTYHKLGNRSHIQNLSFYKAADYDSSQNTVEDFTNALIRFENGASLMVEVSYSLHAKENEASIKLYGDKGGYEIDPAVSIITEKYNTILNIEPQTDHKGFHLDTAFQNEIDHFVHCVLHDQEPISPIADGVEIMKIICGIYESAAKGVEIYL
jgi:predicted dehydrogenase